jgi:hypothetical protein
MELIDLKSGGDVPMPHRRGPTTPGGQQLRSKADRQLWGGSYDKPRRFESEEM